MYKQLIVFEGRCCRRLRYWVMFRNVIIQCAWVGQNRVGPTISSYICICIYLVLRLPIETRSRPACAAPFVCPFWLTTTSYLVLNKWCSYSTLHLVRTECILCVTGAFSLSLSIMHKMRHPRLCARRRISYSRRLSITPGLHWNVICISNSTSWFALCKPLPVLRARRDRADKRSIFFSVERGRNWIGWRVRSRPDTGTQQSSPSCSSSAFMQIYSRPLSAAGICFAPACLARHSTKIELK